MTNFDFLLHDPQFETFAEVAVAAEKILPIDPATAALNCRRAMEFAVKWMYSVDGSLSMPFDDRLWSMMDNQAFRDIVDPDLHERMEYIRRVGNAAAHSGKKIGKVQALNKKNFTVHQHLKFVEIYSTAEAYQALTFENTLQMRDELAPLIQPDTDDPKAMNFDALMYGLELAYLSGEKNKRAQTELMRRVHGIASVANIPEIKAQSELINKILHTSYVEQAEINDFELIREKLRDLMKYIQYVPRRIVETGFDDEILDVQENGGVGELQVDYLTKYRDRAAFYLHKHQDEDVIAKLRMNVPLIQSDLAALEKILWSEIGTQEEYKDACGETPLGEFVREIVGLDMNAAKAAFADYLDETRLDSRQIYFVNQIVEYIVHNGLMKDLSVLQEAPFTNKGSVVDVFGDNIPVWQEIMGIINHINANAITIA